MRRGSSSTRPGQRVMRAPRMTREERAEQREFRKLPLAEQHAIEEKRLKGIRDFYDELLS